MIVFVYIAFRDTCPSANHSANSRQIFAPVAQLFYQCNSEENGGRCPKTVIKRISYNVMPNGEVL